MSKRCVFGCPPGKRSKTGHRFPDPTKYPQQFAAWFRHVPDVYDKENFDFKKYRVCNRHFEEKDKYPLSNRINRIAIPKLYLPKQIDTHCHSAETIINLPTSSSVQVLGESSEGYYETEKSIEVDVASSTWGSLVYDECIPYCGEIYYVSDCIEEIIPQCRTSRPECIGQSFEGPEEQEDVISHEFLMLSTLTPARRIYVEHNYFLSGSCQEANGKSKSRTMLSSKYKKLAAEVKSLRRTVKRLRKGRTSINSRLDEAEKWLDRVNGLTAPSRIFCKMQFSQSNKKLRGRRFTLDEKVLCLSIYKRGPKVYKSLLYKLFTLPSPKTLKTLLARVKLGPGTDNRVLFKTLKYQANLCPPKDRLCSLIFDEMSITPHLHFNSFKDELKGLDNNGCKFATHALVFMIKTISKRFKQPVAFYFTSALSTFELKKYITDVITKVHETGYTIVCTVCDQSATNVAAINSLVANRRANLLRNNREMKRDHFFIDSKKIIPLFDTPHLIKGLRNNLLTKKLKFYDFVENQEKIIEWNFFQQLFCADLSAGGKDFRIARNITEEHIDPLKLNKMKVKLATQLFSRSMATCALHLSNQNLVPKECLNVQSFCIAIDNLFDSLNVSSFQGKTGKPLTAAVKRNSPHHTTWKESIQFLKRFRFIKDNGEESVPPSVKNFIRTIEGFQDIWRLLSRRYSFDALLTRNLNQDPVENFFGNIRSYGARNIAPNSLAFEGAYKALLLNNYSTHSVRANCEEDKDTFLLQNLKVFFNKDNLDDITDTSNVATENEDNIPLIENVDNIFDQISIEDDGPVSYVCGWVVRKCLCKIIKKCQDCRNDILSDKENNRNSFLKIKEYHADKKWLCYPSPEIVVCFRQIQRLCNSYLKTHVTTSGYKYKIKSLIIIFVEFPFKCEMHKDALINFFIDTSLNFLIHSWCRQINRILVGKITRIDETDPLQVMAQEYYKKQKRRHRWVKVINT